MILDLLLNTVEKEVNVPDSILSSIDPITQTKKKDFFSILQKLVDQNVCDTNVTSKVGNLSHTQSDMMAKLDEKCFVDSIKNKKASEQCSTLSSNIYVFWDFVLDEDLGIGYDMQDISNTITNNYLNSDNLLSRIDVFSFNVASEDTPVGFSPLFLDGIKYINKEYELKYEEDSFIANSNFRYNTLSAPYIQDDDELIRSDKNTLHNRFYYIICDDNTFFISCDHKLKDFDLNKLPIEDHIVSNNKAIEKHFYSEREYMMHLEYEISFTKPELFTQPLFGIFFNNDIVDNLIHDNNNLSDIGNVARFTETKLVDTKLDIMNKSVIDLFRTKISQESDILYDSRDKVTSVNFIADHLVSNHENNLKYYDYSNFLEECDVSANVLDYTFGNSDLIYDLTRYRDQFVSSISMECLDIQNVNNIEHVDFKYKYKPLYGNVTSDTVEFVLPITEIPELDKLYVSFNNNSAYILMQSDNYIKQNVVLNAIEDIRKKLQKFGFDTIKFDYRDADYTENKHSVYDQYNNALKQKNSFINIVV